MRLIDADAMLERNKSSIYDTTDLKEMLEYEPTAYDVDKVVSELEKCIYHHEGYSAIDSEEAIEIVKGKN